jgi:hypothetical protein
MSNHAEILKFLNEAGPGAFNDPVCVSTLGDFYSWREYESLSHVYGSYSLEIFTAKVLADDIQAETPALLEKLVGMTLDQSTYPDRSWVHSVAHNFERYGRGFGESDKATFLRDPRFFKAASMIVDNVINCPSDICFSRVVDPIVQYNIDQLILLSGKEEGFPWKPVGLTSEIFSPDSATYHG